MVGEGGRRGDFSRLICLADDRRNPTQLLQE